MKTFEFPQPSTNQQQQSDKPKQPESSKGFFGGFGTHSKNKKATISKEEKDIKDQKIKQYREIIGTQNRDNGEQQQQQQQNQQYLTGAKRSAKNNEWMIDQALKKANAPSQALMSVEIVKKDNNDIYNFDSNDKGNQISLRRPQTAKPLSQQKGEPITLKQMVFFDGNQQDAHNQIEQAMQPHVKQQKDNTKRDKTAHNNQQSQILTSKKQKLQTDKAKSYYQSQYHYEDDYQKEKEGRIDKELLVCGAEMHIAKVDQNAFQRNQGLNTGGMVANFNRSGQMPKAMPSTLKVTNANRFYKGYAGKLAKHHEEKEEHFKSIYGDEGQSDLKENKQMNRPQTAKQPRNSGKSNLYQKKRPTSSYKNIKNFDEVDRLHTMEKQKSLKNLEQMYGKSEKLEQYAEDKEIMKKREETKTELKQLLKKYVANTDHNTMCAQRVGLAQREMHELHQRMDNAMAKIGETGQQFQQTKKDMLGLGEYINRDRFIASEFEKNIERNLKNAKIAWAQANTQSVNDKLREYEKIFDDPTRVPYYDDKGGYFTLSSKFNLEENDDPVYNDDFKHPFLDKLL